MKLYQYTTIEALSLILSNKTIRFSRLDTVDDPEEYGFERNGKSFAPYVFVSCWTPVSEEIIPMWRMYSNKAKRVRIGLDSQMFEVYKYGRGDWPEIFPEGYYYDKDFYIPPLIREQHFCYPLFDIEYVGNVANKTGSIFREIKGSEAVDFKELGKYKKNDWAFQKEKRFVLNVFPKQKNSENYTQISNSINRQDFVQELFLDVPLRENVLDNIEIVLGPLATDSDRIIVKCLMNTFLQRADLKTSSFAGKMRF